MPSKKYFELLDNFVKLSNIAIDAYTKFNYSVNGVSAFDFVIISNKDRQRDRLNCSKIYQNITSLKITINDVLTFFNEASGPIVEYFWEQVNLQNLPFERKDVVGNILKRGYIRNFSEYEYVQDVLVVFEQTGRITHEESNSLKAMVGKFEKRGKKNPSIMPHIMSPNEFASSQIAQPNLMDSKEFRDFLEEYFKDKEKE